MKKIFQKIVVLLALGGLVFSSCKISTDSSGKSSKKYASLSGKAVFVNAEDSSSIYVTLDKTDGLRTADVLSSQGLSSKECYSVSENSTSNSRKIVAYANCLKDGSFKFENLEAGIYTVYATAPDSQERAVFRNITIDEEEEKIILEKLKLTATGTLSGKITLDSSESNNSGFTVYIGGTSYMAKTGLSGDFTITGIPAGKDYELFIEYGTYTYYWKNADVSAFQNYELGTINLSTDEIKSSSLFKDGKNGTDGKDGKNGTDGKDGKNGTDGKDGKNGTDGKDGTPIIWKGSFESDGDIANPQTLWAYYNTTDGCSYIYDGSKWTLLAATKNNSSNYEIRTTTIEPGDSTCPTGGVKIEIIKDGIVVDTTYIENGTSYATYINYELDDGYFTNTPSLFVSSGDTLTLDSPEKEHATFDGWYINKDFSGSKITQVNYDGRKSKITLYAKWIPDLIINYELNGGSFDVTPSVYCKYRNKLLLSGISPEKEHFTFEGWYLSESFDDENISDVYNDGTQTNISIYAKWIQNTKILYELDGGSFDTTTPDELQINKEISLIDIIPSKENYYFDGWYLTDKYDEEEIFKLESNGNEPSITLYAKWVEGKMVYMDELETYLETLTPNEKPYTIKIEKDINFSQLNNMLKKLQNGIYIDLILSNNITSIGDYAFSECKSLYSITIPTSVSSIGSNAFFCCGNLKKVNITDLESWCKIRFTNEESNPLSYAKYLYLDDVEITSLVIPNGVTSIGDYAFFGCSSITSVTIPTGVTSIGDYAFFENGFTSVTIPSSVNFIGSYAFEIENLEEVNITDLKSWCETRFEDEFSNGLHYAKHLYLNGEEITSFEISDNDCYISSYAFSHFKGLTSITISSNITSIGVNAFSYCPNVTTINYYTNRRNVMFCSENVSSLSFIGRYYGYYDNSNRITLNIGGDVTTIPSYFKDWF